MSDTTPLGIEKLRISVDGVKYGRLLERDRLKRLLEKDRNKFVDLVIQHTGSKADNSEYEAKRYRLYIQALDDVLDYLMEGQNV